MKAKEIFNQQAISQIVGIGYDYNEVVGKLSINSPNRVSAKERGIPHMCLRVLTNLSLESQ